MNAVGGINDVLNPSLLTDFRLSFVRYRVDVQSLDYGSNTGEAAGIPGVNVSAVQTPRACPSFESMVTAGSEKGSDSTLANAIAHSMSANGCCRS